ncbi:MAG: CDP-paratose 2-epimerase [Calditrichaeota bacterium]|nr:MAG: CDP-paratose 2-epimerase [Calditrichota bacterium]
MLIKKPLAEVFSFFSNAENLQVITPPNLQFRILTPTPIEMKSGALIDYRIRLFGVPFHWKTEIMEWQPPVKFVDNQISGPYRQWIHTHSFEETKDGVIMTDLVHYKLYGWFLKNIINRYFVAPQIRKIFEFRREKLHHILNIKESSI